MSIATNTASPEQHGAKAHSDGGWDSNEPGYVPVQTRDARFTSVNHDDFPEVKGVDNDWKLTPVKRVLPLIDGEQNAIGTLCVFDDVPRLWTTGHVQILGDFASLAAERAFGPKGNAAR